MTKDIDIIQGFIGSAEMPATMQNDASGALRRLEIEREDLHAKLAETQQELDDLRIRFAKTEQALDAAEQIWQPLTEDDDPVHCRCADFSCNTEAWIDDGALSLEDADGMRVTFWLGPDYAFCKRSSPPEKQ